MQETIAWRTDFPKQNNLSENEGIAPNTSQSGKEDDDELSESFFNDGLPLPLPRGLISKHWTQIEIIAGALAVCATP